MVFQPEEKVAVISIRRVCEPIILNLIDEEVVFLARIDVAILDCILFLERKRGIKPDVGEDVERDGTDDPSCVVSRAVSTANGHTRPFSLSQRFNRFSKSPVTIILAQGCLLYTSDAADE